MSVRRVAVVDMGSNTGRLVLYGLIGTEAWFLEDEIREVVRLRSGMTTEGMSEEAMRRGLAVLSLFRRFCDSVQADTVIATATSAVRDAGNGEAFLERAQEVSGWELRILDAQEEAQFGATGLLAEVPIDSGYVIDIGGGSAQISRVESQRWDRGVSLPLGALRLTEQFFRSDPPLESEVSALRSYIRACLEGVDWLVPLQSGEALGGLGGTVRNLGYIEHARLHWPLPTLRGFTVGRERVEEMVGRFLSVPRTRRARMPGLNPDRADILPAGAIVLQEVMQALAAPGLHTSVNGLREGLLLDHFFRGAPPTGEDLRRFSVDSLGRRYKIRRGHALRVQHLATRLFDQLAALHGLGPSHRHLLEAGSILHDVGTVLGYHDHHRHSETLVALNGLPGWTVRATAMVALLTRYHRKGSPSPGIFRRLLEPGDVAALKWLSAMLRMAEYLERGRNGNVTDVRVCSITDRSLDLEAVAHGDATVEIWDTRRNAVPLLQVVTERKVSLSIA